MLLHYLAGGWGKIMNKSFIYWIPRVLGLFFAFFISLFSLDVFNIVRPWMAQIVALLIHLIPTVIILVTLWIANRHRVIGGLLFLLIGAAFIYQTWGFGWGITLTFGGIPILIAIWFILEGVITRAGRKPTDQDLSPGEA